MRPPRIAILVFFLAACLFLICRAITSASRGPSSTYNAKARTRQSVWGYMYYNTPFSLFPPNAAISLTDDNSTSFPARPAAFGPKLVSKGLSGQLWVGSGFSEDTLDSDGELGCSDLPGWDSGNTRAHLRNSFKSATPRIATTHSVDPRKRGEQLLDPDNRDALAKAKGEPISPVDDGTDNHLTGGPLGAASRHDAQTSSHADIQSIQEAAEIQGKVVLLKRGGCGFLEKVMWAQRRGAVAVIVGDNQKGGPLIQMFAHGEEVENITIPSVFTARTTAHLLSSLTQPGSFIEDTLDDSGNPVLKVQQGVKSSKAKKESPSARSAASSKAASTFSNDPRSPESTSEQSASVGWVSRVFRWHESSRKVDEKSRPPSSGHLDWVVVEDWNDEKDEDIRETLSTTKVTTTKSTEKSNDGFHIGVQDWRDPDLVDKSGSKSSSDRGSSSSSNSGSGKSDKKVTDPSGGPRGGSTTPSSGEYHAKSSDKDSSGAGSSKLGSASASSGKSHGLIAKIFGHSEETASDTTVEKWDNSKATAFEKPSDPDFDTREGLWVTITPTSSASPFFDTLLVLVISPLVTLTVVYALLILRARIRRRRWRAPKSVVERLPVRTYHTVNTTPPSQSPSISPPAIATPTTPLLQHSPPRPRPRSRTTTGILESENFLAPSAPVSTPSLSTRGETRNEHEKGSGGFSAEWRKHMGRQVECVVCLEEYVDGVSKVMSLPCGHEFHADCITPWLTTRRRTCPICKGDVVRSLARGSSSGPRYEPYHDDSDDENEGESSASRSYEQESDLEQGILSTSEARESRRERSDGWLGLLSSSFGGRPRSPSSPPHDRDR